MLISISDIEALLAEQQYTIYYSTDTRTFFWRPALANISTSAFFPYHYMHWWYYAKSERGRNRLV